MTNIETVTDKLAPSAKFTITLQLEGFPVAVEVAGGADKLLAVIDRLRDIGAEPPTASRKLTGTDAKSEDAPSCSIHGKMKKGAHGYFCPRKLDDGSWCRSRG